ncbi:MAG: TonB-dependent receptor [Tannerellaceae bacterium]|jgi:TonB-linked SusC/RagA family outer membrane protein|nr:TonB-dependent receptor [Tannerellaceae bacterium]
MNFFRIKKYVRICYAILFIFLAFTHTQSLTAQQTSATEKITLHVKDQSVEKVFAEISKQTGLKFFYGEAILTNNPKVTLDLTGIQLSAALDKITEQVHLYFSRENNTISVSKDKEKPEVYAVTTPSDENRKISGTVTDENAEPIIGANIIKGSTKGVVTDINGAYTIEASLNDILQISYIGYISQDIMVRKSSRIDVHLKEDSQKLEEVVVIGYGTQKRSNLSGAISKISSEVIESKPVTNTLSALQGEIPGLVIQRASGQPGNEQFDINVRGTSSTNGGNSPLVLIDGVPGDINLINPLDIETISILKDASASIYGARAAGGVILVTTRKGKQGIPTIRYSGNLAVTQMTGMMKSPTNYEMAVMDNEANIHNGSAPMYTPDLLERIRKNDPNPIDHPLYGGWKLFFTNTDWVKEFLNKGVQHKHNITIVGGGERGNYYLSGGYSRQYGVIKYANDNNTRYNLRLNYDYDIAQWLKLEMKVSLENQNRTDVGGAGSWLLTEATFDMPNHPVYNSDGNFFSQGGWGNAVALAKNGETASYNTKNMNTNFKFVGNLSDGLTLNAQIGINYQNKNNEDIANAIPLYTWDNDVAYYTNAGSPQEAAVNREVFETLLQNYTAYLQYTKTSATNHHVDVMLGVSYEKEEMKMFSARRDNFLTDALWSLNIGGTTNMSNDAAAQHWAIGSAFSRIGYNYRNKYIIETSLRYDGSSRFATDSRWRVFPGVSAGWRLSQENFLKDSDFFDELKLRTSYGQTGNQDGIRLYDYVQLLKIRGPYPFGEGSQAQSVYPDVLSGVNRTWEILKNTNLGLDAAFLNSRLNISFDYFWRINNNMLIPVTYPSILGAIPPESNSGKLRTHGFELFLNWKDKIGQMGYSVRLQLSDSQNKLIDYGGADTYELGLNKTREGYPVNTYFAYVYDGVIKDQAELDEYKKLGGVPGNIGIGDAKFKDLNNDGQISTYGSTKGDDGDALNVGSTSPRYTYGINLGADYKGFDFSVFFQGVGKRTLFRTGEYAMPWSDWWRQPPQFYYGMTWNEDRPDAYYPRLTHGEIRYWNYQASTLQQINAAYFRLKNIQLGFTLPSHLLRNIGIEHTRFYISGQDLFEIHQVKGGWDPESSVSGFNYPFQRYYSFGIDLTF